MHTLLWHVELVAWLLPWIPPRMLEKYPHILKTCWFTFQSRDEKLWPSRCMNYRFSHLWPVAMLSRSAVQEHMEGQKFPIPVLKYAKTNKQTKICISQTCWFKLIVYLDAKDRKSCKESYSCVLLLEQPLPCTEAQPKLKLGFCTNHANCLHKAA